MLTDESRRRLCEWEGKCWHEPDSPYAVGVWRRMEYPFDHGMVFQKCTKCGRLLSTSEQEYASNPTYSDWNSVIPLLKRIANGIDGEWWKHFRAWVSDKWFDSGVPGAHTDYAWDNFYDELWMFSKFESPESVANLVSEYIKERDGE